MKYLLTFTFILTTGLIVEAQQCGESQEVHITQETTQDAYTQMPKHLQGAKIIIEKADGSKEILKAEEYMVVKRKFKRPVITHVKNKNTVQCVNTAKKNILSGKLVDGYSDVSVKTKGKSATIEVDRQLGIGLQYQRRVMERMYIGVGADSNQGAEAMVGFDF